ncbi:hypothetical protein KCMC57_up00580 [Kitasatospora sp. CMC57]|uniref:Peptidoglycan binding-like domain-containing protein n=1 Tax=Kitasatospora sp. CMC57 TaxID=3231513 RepID=A0AB33JK08_9ACTN
MSESRTPSRTAPDTEIRRRHRLLVVVIATTLVAGAGGALATKMLKSPAQVAAEMAAPAPDRLTAVAERRIISDTVVLRGKVVATSALAVQGSAPSGVPGARAIVTKVKVKQGEAVLPGQQLFEVSGRPVLTLNGALPAYRDLRTGSTGEDVEQLQRALADIGHPTAPDPKGTFAAGTERAVTAFYKTHGYQPVRTATASNDRMTGGSTPETQAPQPTASPSAMPPAAGDGGAGAVVFPMSEVVYLDPLPARADAVSATVGQAPGEKLMSISTGELVIDATVTAPQKGLLRPGQKAEILRESTGTRATGTVVSVSETAAQAKTDQSGSGATGYPVRIKPDKPLPADLVGQDTRLTVTAASSGSAMLAVPASALSAGANGRSSVSVLAPDGSVQQVTVEPGPSGDGFVAVTAEGPTALAAGDEVVVGVQPRGGRP